MANYNLLNEDTYRSVCVGNHPFKQIEQGAHYITLNLLNEESVSGESSGRVTLLPLKKMSRSLKYDSIFVKSYYSLCVHIIRTGNAKKQQQHSFVSLASYSGPYMRAVRASFRGGIRAWYPLFCARASLKTMNILKLRC